MAFDQKSASCQLHVAVDLSFTPEDLTYALYRLPWNVDLHTLAVNTYYHGNMFYKYFMFMYFLYAN